MNGLGTTEKNARKLRKWHGVQKLKLNFEKLKDIRGVGEKHLLYENRNNK